MLIDVNKYFLIYDAHKCFAEGVESHVEVQSEGIVNPPQFLDVRESVWTERLVENVQFYLFE